jgi:DNA-binding IclR family transcriptional regulator
MVRRSPPTDRVVGVLEVLAAHAGRPLSFSEIMRRVGLTRATCHAVLLSLHDAGYVLRDDNTRTYLLGPAVSALGRVADLSLPFLPPVRHLVRSLVATTGCACALTSVANDWVMVLDHEGALTGPDHLRRGNHVPFVAPYGTIHAAWARPDTRRDWLRGGTDLERLLNQVEARGFSVAPYDEPRRNLRELLALIKEDVLSQELRKLLERTAGPVARDYLDEDMARMQKLPVSSISCPVFDASGHVGFGMHLEVLQTEVDRQTLRSLVLAVKAAAEDATAVLASPARP